MKKTALIIFTMILIGTISVNAQVLLRESTDTSLIMSFLPKNLNIKRMIKTIVVTTDFSKEKAIVDTAKIPFLYGKPVSKSISISEGSSWSDGESSYAELKISSPGASSLSLNFSKFALSGSALLYIYNEDHDMILGPITSKENNKQGTYGIAPLKGGAITVLLREKDTKSLKTVSQIVISEVIIGYRDVYKSQQSAKGLNDSEPCMVDIACREDWDGGPTARYFTGGSQCTGALVNNENNDGRPFFLTAFHCLDSDNDGTLNANEVNATSNYTFQFFYRRETCLGSVLNSVWQFYGATWRAAYEGTDFALVELFNALPIESNLSLYGWNRSNTPPNWGASIHHPSGDVQKISFTGLIQTSTFSANMWGVEWNLGVTEGGSSGAPLFNESKQVIGQLRGGSSSCSNPTLNDRFGKFGKSWDLQPLAHTQLKYWLSPNQDLFEIAPLDRGLLTGPSNICYGQNATYNMPNLPSGYTITWSVSSQLNIVSSTAGSVTVSPISINSSENGYIRASLNDVVFREYKVIVGVPAPAVSIRMYHSACIGGSDWEASFDITPVTPNLQYIWIYNGAEYPPSTSPDFSIYEFPANPITLNLRVKTSCGISPKLLANDATYYPPCGFSWLISPNPSSTEFEVSKNSGGSSKTVDQKQAFQVTLLDNTGKTIRTGSSSSGSTKINVESVPNGTYFIHINDGTQTIKKQVIVRH
ncbi:T9SS type A sorting domain-containing protein [Pedobacter alluvionis]|uniref:Putative secreted protein (Por secretion system target) n=1 Tax=Pedobacter alluvionis TaxID=475253 RepID=A0A497YCC5_9SPHI|nr:T9SS type A sorting domain-containing protein [Pedobacter alluvionis]RLJ80328.1 putative secreted protein (Por secretion system target) [Pedobacter alluvionis]TFB31598.1 T9SS type A sorting domain-containing protein [Pedobacter alluvionis]